LVTTVFFLNSEAINLRHVNQGDIFQIPLLRLGLISENAELTCQMLDAYDPENHAYLRFEIANLIGTHIKNHLNRDLTLEYLAKHPNGRFLFFETFVDEDNANGYFSNALARNYLPYVNNAFDYLFVDCFLFSHHYYSNETITSSLKLPQFSQRFNPELPFHITSRLWECYFLKYLSGFNKREAFEQIDELLRLSEPYPIHERPWILARVIRAFSIHGKVSYLIQHDEYMASCALDLSKKEPKHFFVSEFLIQALLLNHQKYKPSPEQLAFTPKNDYYNDVHHKVLLDSFYVASIERNEQRKAEMYKHIVQAGKALNKNWIRGLIEPAYSTIKNR